LQGTNAFGGIIGPVLAGVAITSIGAIWVMALNALSFGVSVLSLSFVRTTTASTATSTIVEKPGWISDFLGGLRFIASHPTLRWMVIIRSSILVLSSGSFAIILFRMQHDLRLNANIIGIILGAGALGAVLSSFIVSPIRLRFGFGVCFLGGAILVAISSILYGIAPAGKLPWSFAAGVAIAVPVMILAELLTSFGDNLIVINTMSLRQALTPDQLQGRVTAFLQLTIWVLAPVMTTVSTLLAAHVGATAVLVGMGVLSLVLIILGMFTPVRLSHPENIPTR
jgi:MFS family permease